MDIKGCPWPVHSLCNVVGETWTPRGEWTGSLLWLLVEIVYAVIMTSSLFS